MSKHHDPASKLYLDVEARQRNTIWPDTMANSRGVDELIFKGSPKATRVQRFGVFILGVLYTLAGVSFILIGREQHSFVPATCAMIILTLGVWVIRNAFLRPAPKPRNHHPHRIPDPHDP
jgi:hypothetical protein